MNHTLAATYGQKIRIRAVGVLLEEEKMLLVKMLGIGKEGIFWSPPGGGVEFGETISQAIEREFQEETDLLVKTKDFLLIHEYIEPPLHAIELFYGVERIGGELRLGSDPEIQQQFISEVRFLDKTELLAIPPLQRHPRLEELFRRPHRPL